MSSGHQLSTATNGENTTMIRYDFNPAAGKFEEQRHRYALQQHPQEQQLQMQQSATSYSSAQGPDHVSVDNYYYKPNNMRTCLMSAPSHPSQAASIGTSAKCDVISSPTVPHQQNDVALSSCMMQRSVQKQLQNG